MENKKRFLEPFSSYDDLNWLQINLSQENYDSIYNGPRPNGSSPSWYIKETGKLHPPMNMGEWNFKKETGEWFSNSQLLNQHQPHILDINHVTYHYPKDLIGKKHLYIITVFNPHYFKANEHIGFSVIHPQYLEDIKIGNAYIVIFYPWEGYSGMDGNRDFEIVEKWRISAGLPLKSVHFITGNLHAENNKTVKNGGLITHPLSIFDVWNSNLADEPIVEFKPSENNNLFLSYNRNPRLPRVHLACKMLEYGLLDKGVFSLDKPDWFSNLNTLKHDGILDKYWNELGKRVPITISKNLNFNLACNIELSDFESTFCSIITETLVENNTMFFSEKIWKAIQTGHPFFLIGNPGGLQALRSKGYHTFSNWWNEEYDNVYDYRLRIEMIMKEVKKLSEYPVERLIEIRKEMKQALMENKIRHYNQIRANWGFGHSEKPEAVLRLLNNIYTKLQNGQTLL